MSRISYRMHTTPQALAAPLIACSELLKTVRFVGATLDERRCQSACGNLVADLNDALVKIVSFQKSLLQREAA